MTYQRIDVLPKWAYIDSEWSELIENVDAIIDGEFYEFFEPEVLSDEDIAINKLFE
jgi:hypothetical protein